MNYFNVEVMNAATNDQASLSGWALTAVLLALLVGSAMFIQPLVMGSPSPSIKVLAVTTLLPIATVVALSVLERLLPPAGPRKSFGRWLLHMQITIFFTMMVGLSVAVASKFLATIAGDFGLQLGLIDLRFADGTDLLTLFGVAWIAAVVGDFFFYWYHRSLHVIPWLWAHHKMHHMDTELDASTLARQNWIEVVFAAILIVVPTAVLFKLDTVDAWGIGILAGVVSTVFGTLLTIGHANLRWQAGWASVLWCSPQVHRIHHSCLPEHQDKNFAFILPLWDVLFGSYYGPKRGEFPPTGVPGEREITGFWESQIFTQREWWRMYQGWLHRRRQGGRVPSSG